MFEELRERNSSVIRINNYITKRNGLFDYQQAVVVLKVILSFLLFSFRRIPGARIPLID